MAAGSTLADVAPRPERRAALVLRRCVTGALAVLVVAGACGVFGVRSRSTSTSGGGYSLGVTYPQTARAGLDVPWRVTVARPGGFPSDITIAVSSDYFRMFETQGFFPDADSETNDGRFVYFTFDKPPGDRFVLEYDAYIQPAAQLGKSASVELLIAGSVVAHTKIRTWLVP